MICPFVSPSEEEVSMSKLLSIVALLLIVGATTFPISYADEEVPLRHGLKMELYEGREFETLRHTTIDPNVDHFWDWGSPHENLQVDNFSVRWTGWISAPRDGRYKLAIPCNDGLRVTLKGTRIIDEWHPSTMTFEASVDLTIEPQPITIEFCEYDGTCWIGLLWQPVGAKVPIPIPTEAFYPDEASAKAKRIPESKSGLVAECYAANGARIPAIDRFYRTEAIALPPVNRARLTGILVPRHTGQHKLIGFVHDHLRVWIDDQPLMSVEAKQGKTDNVVIDLEAGKPYAIKIEFIAGNKGNNFYLHWTEPFQQKELPIPPECLFINKAEAQKAAQ
jgi:PA14 domain